jgi:hypothetical protein
MPASSSKKKKATPLPVKKRGKKVEEEEEDDDVMSDQHDDNEDEDDHRKARSSSKKRSSTLPTTAHIPQSNGSNYRPTVQGCWILDKEKTAAMEASCVMSSYLAVMNVDPLAIEAHEKGERETDTFHTIEFFVDDTMKTLHDERENSSAPRKVRLTKRSRVNNDVVVTLSLGAEQIQYLTPGHRAKKMLASASNPLTQLRIDSSLQTDHGLAKVVDIKTLLQEPDEEAPSAVAVVMSTRRSSKPNIPKGRTWLCQVLTITNQETGASHTTTRYFCPYHEMPPHLVKE